VTFIDIDYKELMLKKRDVVQSTKELSSMLGKFEILEEGDILLRSENYLQLVWRVIPVLF
jgi:tRNA wybutosine-synthesizing protein 4